jgi:hypothetical protein
VHRGSALFAAAFGAVLPHWLAGHIGLEPANPSASYLIEFTWQLGLR